MTSRRFIVCSVFVVTGFACFNLTSCAPQVSLPTCQVGDPNCVQPTHTPTPTPTPDATTYSLHSYAKISDDADITVPSFAAQRRNSGIGLPWMIKDGYIGLLNKRNYLIGWIDGYHNNSDDKNVAMLKKITLKMEWPQDVIIESIRLFDNPYQADSTNPQKHRIRQGELNFIAYDDNGVVKYVPPIAVDSLMDRPQSLNDGDAFTGPNIPVRAITFKVSDATGRYAGLSEIVVRGRYVDPTDKAKPGSNIAPYGQVIHQSGVCGLDCVSSLGSGEQSQEFVDGSNAGPFQSRHINDGRFDHIWRSANNGNSSSVQMEFKIAYCISEIEVYDVNAAGPGHPATFTQAEIVMGQNPQDANAKRVTLLKQTSSSTKATPADPNWGKAEQVQWVRINLTNTTGTSEKPAGIAEVILRTCVDD